MVKALAPKIAFNMVVKSISVLIAPKAMSLVESNRSLLDAAALVLRLAPRVLALTVVFNLCKLDNLEKTNFDCVALWGIALRGILAPRCMSC